MVEALKGCAVLVASYGLAVFAKGVMGGKRVGADDDMAVGLGAVAFGVGAYAVIVGWL